jgi:hypothetical protein
MHLGSRRAPEGVLGSHRGLISAGRQTLRDSLLTLNLCVRDEAGSVKP